MSPLRLRSRGLRSVRDAVRALDDEDGGIAAAIVEVVDCCCERWRRRGWIGSQRGLDLKLSSMKMRSEMTAVVIIVVSGSRSDEDDGGSSDGRRNWMRTMKTRRRREERPEGLRSGRPSAVGVEDGRRDGRRIDGVR